MATDCWVWRQRTPDGHEAGDILTELSTQLTDVAQSSSVLAANANTVECARRRGTAYSGASKRAAGRPRAQPKCGGEIHAASGGPGAHGSPSLATVSRAIRAIGHAADANASQMT